MDFNSPHVVRVALLPARRAKRAVQAAGRRGQRIESVWALETQGVALR